MKLKLSVSMDPELVNKAEEKVKEGTFRNKSHIIEFALKHLLEENDES